MQAINRIMPAQKPLIILAFGILSAGVMGMVVSFHFLMSEHHLDVLSGAAGFVAGSILAGSGLVAIAILRQPAFAGDGCVETDQCSPACESTPAGRHWLAHFAENRLNRREPDWNAPITLSADVVRPLLRSLEQFQLGDGGGPLCLIAWNAESFLSSSGETRELVKLWFDEEAGHARLLKAAVDRFGGQCIEGHWSFSAFCMVRKWIGVRFELTVLLLTELVSTVYYRLLRRHTDDVAVRGMCRLILRDESGHVAFHRDRLALAARSGRARHGMLWEWSFRVLGLAAATMLWVNHARGLRAVGACGTEFYREVWMELSRFLRRLQRESM